MGDFLVVAPPNWEKATDAMLQLAIEGTGNIEGVQSLIDSKQFGELFNLMDPIRSNSENITDAILLQGQLWFTTI